MLIELEQYEEAIITVIVPNLLGFKIHLYFNFIKQDYHSLIGLYISNNTINHYNKLHIRKIIHIFWRYSLFGNTNINLDYHRIVNLYINFCRY